MTLVIANARCAQPQADVRRGDYSADGCGTFTAACDARPVFLLADGVPIARHRDCTPSIALSRAACIEGVTNLNQLLADTLTLRDLYRKHHWQVAGPTFSELHALFEKHYRELDHLIDAIAERVQLLGGVSLAMPQDVGDTTIIPRAPRGREPASVQISRLLHAHEVVLKEARTMARLAADQDDAGTHDLIVSGVIRLNEHQAWVVAAHAVDVPEVRM